MFACLFLIGHLDVLQQSEMDKQIHVTEVVILQHSCWDDLALMRASSVERTGLFTWLCQKLPFKNITNWQQKVIWSLIILVCRSWGSSHQGLVNTSMVTSTLQEPSVQRLLFYPHCVRLHPSILSAQYIFAKLRGVNSTTTRGCNMESFLKESFKDLER